MGVSKGYRKPTSKRRLREEYQKELDALPVGDPKRLTIIRLMARLEGIDSKLRATDYPDRHKPKKKSVDDEPEQVVIPDDGDEPLSGELLKRTEDYERSERAWRAYFNRQPLPDDAPAIVRFIAGTNYPSRYKGHQAK